MNLRTAPFDKIKSGSKKIELRLYDKKRKKISAGDTVCFINPKNEQISVTVKAIYVFKDFEELYRCLPLEKCGYSKQELPTASADDMLEYYSERQIKQYGVIGIEIE